MRYVSWFEGWLGHLLPQRRGVVGAARGEIIIRPAAELSSEDLFYIAMLGPHV
ncbi:hypothetical protein BRAO375_800022 [Bradyrhizobium sp. ORS 375]|uniref:hypothetical protein n=1 Tax=Bradyrhizobium sp. (strain ORS 375) TaxID=566679 RepID=UPI000240866C|nr:hypothetical protein [Bradyrhizobium sp. ORS 375]CCD96901.1 hypothetical protein BRAO375_800022 [Bradyrhizobium sp. ORS 375]